MTGLIINNQIIEVSEACMNVLLTVARSMGTQVEIQANTQASVLQAPVSTPAVSTPKVYDHVTEGFANFQFVRKDNTVSVTHKDGTFVHEKAVRSALNARLKAAGFVYDKDAKCWVLLTKSGKRDIKGATAFVTEHSNEVTADELNAVRDKWTSASAKRAGKATK